MTDGERLFQAQMRLREAVALVQEVSLSAAPPLELKRLHLVQSLMHNSLRLMELTKQLQSQPSRTDH